VGRRGGCVEIKLRFFDEGKMGRKGRNKYKVFNLGKCVSVSPL
jgi:hypothetical protein